LTVLTTRLGAVDELHAEENTPAASTRHARSTPGFWAAARTELRRETRIMDIVHLEKQLYARLSTELQQGASTASAILMPPKFKKTQ
jgi:hypothetical protein